MKIQNRLRKNEPTKLFLAIFCFNDKFYQIDIIIFYH